MNCSHVYYAILVFPSLISIHNKSKNLLLYLCPFNAIDSFFANAHNQSIASFFYFQSFPYSA